MRQANVSSVLVHPDTAIVTERDLTRALSAGLDPGSAVTAVSVTDLVSVDQDTTVVEAAGEMLRHEIRHLVVCNHRGDVTGMVTLRDVMRILVDAMDPPCGSCCAKACPSKWVSGWASQSSSG